tara:strand:+ start:261 stop:1097 length:837 start_codon:yes stop_codon:yes gene_type:complete
MSEDQVTEVEQQSQPSETTATIEPTATTTEVSWRDALPDDLKSNESLGKFSDISTLAKSYINAEQMIGKDKMVVPGANTTEDEWSDIYDKLGRPSAPDAYELTAELGEGEEVDAQLMSSFKETAHKHGLSPAQAQGLLDYYNNISTQSMTDMANNSVLVQEQSQRELREEWGGSYEANLSQASNIGKQFFGEEIYGLQMADGSQLGDNPTLIKGLAKMASVVSEDTLVGDKQSAASGGNFQQQINDLTSPNSAYWNKMDPQHDATVQKVLALRSMISG